MKKASKSLLIAGSIAVVAFILVFVILTALTSEEPIPTDYCGDNKCSGSETNVNCPGDCPIQNMCGDGTCSGAETQANCPSDCAVAPSGLIAHYPLETLNSVVGQNLVLSGSPMATTDSAVGSGAYRFYGTEGYLTAGTSSAFDMTDKVTVAAWVKFNSLKHSYIVSKVNSFMIQMYVSPVNGTGSLQGGIYRNIAGVPTWTDITHYGSTSTLQVGKWYHIVFVYDTSVSSGQPSALLYINGQLVDSQSSIKDVMTSDSTRPINIGGRGEVGYDRNTNGIIDDVRIYNRVLTGTEIQQLFNLKNSGISMPTGSIVPTPSWTDYGSEE